MGRTDDLNRALHAIARGATAHSQESSTLDFKQESSSEDATSKDTAEAAICFANSSGGTVVLGVLDKVPGRAAFVGTKLSREHLQKRIYDLSRPPLSVEVQELAHEAARLLVVNVAPSIEIHSDTRGRATRRIGTDCMPMDPGEQARLREERHGIDWSSQPSEFMARDVNARALAVARERLAAFTDARRALAQLSDVDLLRSLKVINGEGTLLRAGSVLFCDGQSAAIVYQYRQTPGGEPRAVERLPAPLLLAYARVMEFVQARRNVTPVSLPDGQQISIEDFPELAVREALSNAVIHRDYHFDLPVVVEHSPEVFAVISPGPLVSGVTPENILTHPSKPRNPLLANAARLLGMAEEVGRGVDRIYREMIRSGRAVPEIYTSSDSVRVTLVGGAPNTQIARYAAQLPEHERDDTDTMLILFRLCAAKTVNARELAPLLQKTVEESEASLRRLASDQIAMLEPTRQTARLSKPSYRLRGEVIKALGAAIPYQRRTIDEIDRKIIAHVNEYQKITNKTVQNLLDVSLHRAATILADLVERRLLKKISSHERGPGVEYGKGSRFPARKKGAKTKKTPSRKG